MTSPSPAGSSPALDLSHFTIHSRLEILYILRAIQHKNELVTAYFNRGNDFILTSILDVDPSGEGSLILDSGSEEARNRRLLESDRVILATTQDRVKVQFAVENIEKTEYLGRPAFRASLPDELLKLQRREYYRVDTPLVNAVKCVMSRPGGGIVEVVVSDISLGGVAISNYQNLLRLAVGDRFEHCRIALPAGAATPGIEVRNEQEIVMKNGAKIHRAGCMFLDLPSSQQAMIQRYIIKLERERRAKLAE